MRNNRVIGWVTGGLLLASAAACGDDDNPSGGNGGGTQQAGSGGDAGSAGQAGSGGDAGSAGATAGTNSQGGNGGMGGSAGMTSMGGSAGMTATGGTNLTAPVDAGADAALADDAGSPPLDSGLNQPSPGVDSGLEEGPDGGSADSGAPIAFNCPAPNPTPAQDQVFVIESANVETGAVVLRNVSGTAQTITDVWKWCDRPAYGDMVAADTEIADNETFSFSFSSADTVGGEMGIYTAANYTTPTAMLTYVSWGTGPNAPGRESVAVTAGWWATDDRIALDPGHVGFIATGASNSAAGFTSVPAECFQ